MQIQVNTSPSTSQIIRRALVALAILLWIAALAASLGQVAGYLVVAIRQTLVLLPSFALSGWQALQSGSAFSSEFSLCSIESLIFWPLVTSAAKLA
jgi:hypothetical protein